MSLNYDQPDSTVNVTQTLQANPTITSTTFTSIQSILGLDEPGGTVVVGSMDASGNVNAPQGQTPQMIVVDIDTPAGQTVTIPISPAVMETNKVWVFDTDANIMVRFNTIERVIVTGRGNDEFIVAGDANTTIQSAGGNDTISTSGGNDSISIRAGGNSSVTAGTGNDTILAGTGSDTIDAGSGIDIVTFEGTRASFTANISAEQVGLVNAAGTSVLTGVERLHFSDKKIALDLQEGQNAAMSLQIINVVAAELRDDPEIVGMILEMFDAGYDLESLAQHAIDVGWVTQFAGSTSNQDIAEMAYKNAFGVEANAAQLDWALSFMDGRLANYTQAEFIAAAAQIDENNVEIDLIGIQQTGVEYLG